jgi:nitrile hydratase beta subunit
VNGIHDMGGMHGMGPIAPEQNEPVFHATWEGRVYAIDSALDGDWPGGAERHQQELIPPAEYLLMSYYERWLTMLEQLLVKSGAVSWAELKSGHAMGKTSKKWHLLTASEVPAMIATVYPPCKVPADPHFRVGQRVRGRNMHPPGHTRLPRYTRGRIGTIERDHGVFVFYDTRAHGLGDKPQHVYTVRFAARDLWGEQAAPQDSVYVDLWDDYLEPA